MRILVGVTWASRKILQGMENTGKGHPLIVRKLFCENNSQNKRIIWQNWTYVIKNIIQFIICNVNYPSWVQKYENFCLEYQISFHIYAHKIEYEGREKSLLSEKKQLQQFLLKTSKGISHHSFCGKEKDLTLWELWFI